MDYNIIDNNHPQHTAGGIRRHFPEVTAVIDFEDIGRYRENFRLEAKRAVGGLPESIWETYSAFANTLGGLILLGVAELEDKSFAAVVLPDPEYLAEEFLEKVSDPAVVSANILREDSVRIEECDGRRIVVIDVPRAPRELRPVYCGSDPVRGSYYRSGESDLRIPPDVVRRIMERR